MDKKEEKLIAALKSFVIRSIDCSQDLIDDLREGTSLDMRARVVNRANKNLEKLQDWLKKATKESRSVRRRLSGDSLDLFNNIYVQCQNLSDMADHLKIPRNGDPDRENEADKVIKVLKDIIGTCGVIIKALDNFSKKTES